MILSSETPIEETENAGQLHDRLMDLGSKLSLPPEMIEKGTVSTIIQTDTAHIKTAQVKQREL
jgi:methionyl-tRNA formyltransferase